MFNNVPRRQQPQVDQRYLPPEPGVKTITQENTPPEEKVHVYVDHQRKQMGDIAKMPQNWSLYDLFFEDSADAERLRALFHDWAIPPRKYYTTPDGKLVRKILSSVTFYRGSVTASSFHPEQYVYVILNNLLEPAGSWGNPEGTDVGPMSILVCCYIGDTRMNGFLSNAYIEYVIRLNTPWTQWCKVAGIEIDPETGRPFTAYHIVGDQDWRQKLTDRWFRQRNDFYFNRVIYPVSQNGITDQM